MERPPVCLLSWGQLFSRERVNALAQRLELFFRDLTSQAKPLCGLAAPPLHRLFAFAVIVPLAQMLFQIGRSVTDRLSSNHSTPPSTQDNAGEFIKEMQVGAGTLIHRWQVQEAI